MEFVQLKITSTQRYTYDDASNVEMYLLGRFLSSDIGCRGRIYKEWALADKEAPDCKFYYGCSSNTTYLEELEERDDYIYLGDNLPEPVPEILKISRQQFVQLLDNWWEVACDTFKPNTIVIKEENGQFTIERS